MAGQALAAPWFGNGVVDRAAAAAARSSEMIRALLLYTAMGLPAVFLGCLPAAFLGCLAALWVWHRWGPR